VPEITVYTRPQCRACDATKATLTGLGLAFRAVDVSEDRVVAQGLVDAGFRAMPVVRVEYLDGEIDYWSGFQADKIAALA
jgi:glutaredoxin-like protein NrdH